MLADLRNTILAALLGLAIGALGSWWLTAEYKDSVWGKAVSDQKVEAGKVLQEETEKVLTAEREASRLKDEMEKQHAKSSAKIERTLADNRRLTRELGGLRDPGRRSSGGCPTPGATEATGSSAGGAAEGELPGAAEGLLSAEASEFLLEFAAEADRAAEYAQLCYRWANRPVTALPGPEAAPAPSP